MPNLVLVSQAVEETGYTAQHVSYLLRNKLVQGKKQGGIWLIDLDDLKQYKQSMDELGTKKFDPTKRDETS
jgi:hypothetical protein